MYLLSLTYYPRSPRQCRFKPDRPVAQPNRCWPFFNLLALSQNCVQVCAHTRVCMGACVCLPDEIREGTSGRGRDGPSWGRGRGKGADFTGHYFSQEKATSRFLDYLQLEGGVFKSVLIKSPDLIVFRQEKQWHQVN